MNQESLAFSDGSVNAVAIAPKVKSVIGIDFTPAMIARAEKKLEELNIENIDLINADIAAIDFAESSFDLITCSLAIALFPDIPQVLGKWYQWLKKGGSVAFSCHNLESHFLPLISGVCRETYGFELPNLHTPIATPEKCHQLLENAGFTNISVNVKQLGRYLPLETAKNFWYGQYFHPQDNPLDLALRPSIGCRNCDSSEQLSPRNREKCHRSGSMARCNHFFCHC
jgi:protein-L-isoaspartate(D-aspartate) O-methyltransferase